MILDQSVIGSNFILRSLTKDDASARYAGWLNDPDVTKFLTTKSATIPYLQSYIEERNADHRSLLLGIFVNRKHIGNVNLVFDHDAKSAEFGIMIGDKDYWNRGIGAQVTQIVVDHAFNNIGMRKVELGVVPGHETAIHIYKKIGFEVVRSDAKQTWMHILNTASVYAVVQVRMGSSRLKRKSLRKIGERTSIGHVLNRVKKSKRVSHVVLSTGFNTDNDPLIEEAKRYGVLTHRGDDDLLLNRYYECAKEFGAETVVRITGDCPFIDPNVIDKVIDLFHDSGADYASNVHPCTFPDGFDVEVFSTAALNKAWRQVQIDSDREHATPYMWKKLGLFKCVNLKHHIDLSSMRIVLDYQDDLLTLRSLAEHVDLESDGVDEIAAAYRDMGLFDLHPRNEGYAESIRQEPPTCHVQKSDQWIRKNLHLTPGAAQTYSKSYRHFAYPVFLEKGEGSHVWDVDGNEYVDFNCGLGAVVLGYNNEYVNKRCLEQMSKGVSFSQPTVVEAKLAHRIIDTIPSAEMVKFMKNGSDATTAAVRLARAYTGREVIARCGYHGYHDWYIGSTTNNRGVPKSVQNLTVEFNYNDIESLLKIISEHPDNVAGIILEPIQNNGPCDGFLEKIRKVCDENRIVLIFDEVLSGFRVDIGGAQKKFGVTPDLSSFGKAIANGFPLSVLVGCRQIMKLIDEGVFISTTFGGDALSLAAALATLDVMDQECVCQKVWALGNVWKNEVQNLIDKHNMDDVKIVGLPCHCGVTFSSIEKLSFYQQFLAEQGILTMGINNFCLAHTDRDIHNFVRAVDAAFHVMKNSSRLPFSRKYRINPVFNR